MSIIPTGLALKLKFYLSGPAPCAYLNDKVERKLFTYLNDESFDGSEINAALCRAGFRRSQHVAYRPACPACNACVPVRIPARLFSYSRSLKRIRARNRDLRVERLPLAATVELYNLFKTYETARHSDSEMAHMSFQEFEAMLSEADASTRLYALVNADGEIKGCVIADAVGDGLSAVYSFFDPSAPRQSLGTALILALIETAKAEKLPFVYLGYWIASARKMAYKSRFKPLQHLQADSWITEDVRDKG